MSRVAETAYFNVRAINNHLLVNPLAQGLTVISSPHEGRWGIATWFDCFSENMFSIALSEPPTLDEHGIYAFTTTEGEIYQLARLTYDIYIDHIKPLIGNPVMAQVIEQFLQK